MPHRSTRFLLPLATAIALQACQAPAGMAPAAPGTGPVAPAAAGGRLVPPPAPPAELQALFARPRAYGRVAAAGPVADATITVLGPDGKPIAPLAGERTTTNVNGMYSLRFEALPADFKIVAKGGTVGGKPFAGELVTVVRGHASATRQPVNVATTLAARYLEATPGATRADAEAAVKRYFGVPAGFDLGWDIEDAREIFDAADHVAEAERLGGFAAFADRHVGEIQAGGTHPHATRATYRTQQAAALAGAAAGWLGKTLATGAVSYVGSLGMGWLLAKAGVGGTTDPDRQRMLADLDALKTSVNQLSSQLTTVHDDLARRVERSGYDGNGNVKAMLDLVTANRHVDSQLRDLASYTASQATDIAQTQQDIRTYVAGHFDDALTKWDVALRGAGMGDSGAIAAWSRYVAADHGGYFGPGSRASIQTWWDQVDAQQADTVRILVEYRHDRNQEVVSTLTTWRDQRENQLKALRGTALATDTLDLTAAGLTPAHTIPLGRLADGVIVDTTKRLMWRPAGDRQLGGRHGTYCAGYYMGIDQCRSQQGIAATAAKHWTGVDGWRAATAAELRGLFLPGGGNIARLNAAGFALPAGVSYFAAPPVPATYFNADSGASGTTNDSSTGLQFLMVRTLGANETYAY